MQCPNCQAEIPSKARFCSMCGKPAPKKAASGVNIGDVGMIQELHIGAEKEPPAPGGDYCPICGVWVKVEDSFRCKQCGRTSLHREHRDPDLNMCSECARQVRPAEPARKLPLKATPQGDKLVLTLAEGVEMTFLRVPAGVFLMGSAEDDEDADDDEKLLHKSLAEFMAEPEEIQRLEKRRLFDYDEKPQHKVHLDEYWIGKTPVTNAQYQVFVEATGHATPDGWEKGKVPKGKEDHPVVDVSWQDARDFCVWASQVTGEAIRLPSEAEWEKAARGAPPLGGARIYPWGDQKPDVDLCNFGDNVGDTTHVGRYSPQGDSPYGCVDMAGNVDEWTSTLFIYKSYPYRASDGREDPEGEGPRVLRGGAWYSNEYNLRASYRDGCDPDNTDNSTGFRCSSSH